MNQSINRSFSSKLFKITDLIDFSKGKRLSLKTQKIDYLGAKLVDEKVEKP